MGACLLRGLGPSGPLAIPCVLHGVYLNVQCFLRGVSIEKQDVVRNGHTVTNVRILRMPCFRFAR
jgi:hypothetical protein